MLKTTVKQALLFVGAVTLLLGAPAISHAENGDTAEDVTALAAVTAPADARAVKRTRDGNVETYAKLAQEEGYVCSWTEAEAVACVYIKWYELPDSAILVQTDASGAEIARETLADPVYNACYPVSENARGIRLVSADETLLVSELTLYTAGELPEGVYDWRQPAEKADLLVVAAHCDDELLYFGGTIPYYAGERGLSVQVVYMANDSRTRVDEALNGLWHLGVRNAPVFLPFRDAYTTTLQDALRRWGEDETVETLVGVIRRFRPEVIVTHDLNGEYGHGAHRATAACMVQAVPLAEDASAYPAACETCGSWQVQKLYLHLYGENRITMDWRVPLSAFGGKTALELANEAYAMHVSQQEFHQTVYDTGDYSSAEFGLAYTAVGLDEAKDDFFEHIDPSRLTNYVAPTPEPTAEPTPSPTPSAAPTPSEAPSASTESTASPAGLKLPLAIAAILLLAAVAVLLGLRLRGGRKR